MPKIIKDQAVVEDDFQLLLTVEGELPSGPVLLPLSYWQDNKEALLSRGDFGVVLNSDEPPALIADDIDKLSLIAINFPAFADGRGFSYAQTLRSRYGFKGELRAVGDVFRDQLDYLNRCGFNSMAITDEDIHEALESLKDFSEPYQMSVVHEDALFRRHQR